MTGYILHPRRGRMLKTGQVTQYNSEPDDGLTQKGLAKSYTVLSTGQYSGNTNIDLTHLQSSTGSFDGATHTYTDAGKCVVFKAAGGETIIISGSSNGANNGTFTTASATANTVVVTAGFATVAAGDAIVVKKREVHANICALDNNTGLMWQKNFPNSVGILGTGLLPWYDVTKAYDMFLYAAACNAANLSGYNDWRVANILELFNLLDFEQPTCAPNAAIAIGTSSLWCSNTVVSNATQAYVVNFSSAFVTAVAKTTDNRFILVRGG